MEREGHNGSLTSALTLNLTDELVQRIAERAVEMIARQQDESVEDGWLRGADKIADYIDSRVPASTRSPRRDVSPSTTTARR